MQLVFENNNHLKPRLTHEMSGLTLNALGYLDSMVLFGRKAGKKRINVV